MDLINGSKTSVVAHTPLLDVPTLNTWRAGDPVQSRGLGIIHFLLFQKNYSTPTVVCSKELIEKSGYFPSRKHAEDFEFFIRLRLKSKTWLQVLHPRTVVLDKHYFSSGSGLSSQTHKMQTGVMQALTNSLKSTRWVTILPALYLWHMLKYVRRIIILNRANGREKIRGTRIANESRD
ncbi:MAG: hypothetical protein EOP04_23090 [Proteobacteria bacterium]|nr:MAG: hypothetical protein EOP04_23090 [Pseudomonadota bacterium]